MGLLSQRQSCLVLIRLGDLLPLPVVVVVVVVKNKFLSHPTVGGVILRLGTLPEPWESENTSEDLRRS